MMDRYYTINVLGYVMGASSLLGIIQYSDLPLIVWILIGVVGVGAMVVSNSKYRDQKHLLVDSINFLVIALVIYLLPNSWGFYLNVITAILVIVLFAVKRWYLGRLR